MDKLKAIAADIMFKYPSCCLANNVNKFGNRYILESKYDLTEALLSFFNYEKLGLCGCGNPEDTWKIIRTVLTIQNDYHDKEKDLDWDDIKKRYEDELKLNTDDDIDNGIYYFILYILNDRGFLEHGSSAGSSWLTNLGKQYLYVLDMWYKDDTEEATDDA